MGNQLFILTEGEKIMSDYQREKGKLTIISRDKSEFENIALDILKSKDMLDRINEDYTAIEFLRDEFYDEYIINGRVFAVISEYERLDNEYDFCDMTKIDDNTLLFHTMYYNGGTCMSEMIEDELSELGII